MTLQEITTIGVSEAGDAKLDEMKEAGLFAEKMDGLRFAVALAIAQGAIPGEIAKRKPFLNLGSLDPDQALKRTVEVLMPEEVAATTPYRLIERLADWGVTELYSQMKSGGVDFQAILEQVEDRARE